MKAFLRDSAVVKVKEVEYERELRLDVFGKLQASEVDAKVIEVATVK